MAITREDVRRLDAADPLAHVRDAFALTPGEVYLDGNSLGAMPLAVADRVADVVTREWGRDLIRSWNSAGWIGAPQRVGGKIARLIGAKPHEVVVADSTSVNLFKLLSAAIADRQGRTVILAEPGNFPTDLYIAQGIVARAEGVELRVVPRHDIMAAIDETVAVVMLTDVHYRSGERFDMAAITLAAHDKGALVLWDLCHSAGAVEVDLNGCDADLAVGCGYKYLNGGPGAPALLFVAERHQERLQSPLTGWMGHAQPFQFGDDYAAGQGIKRFLCGTPPIIGLSILEQAVDLFLDQDLPRVFAKGQQLCSLFIDLVEQRCAGLGLTLATPRNEAVRGSHVSFTHEQAYPVMQALIARGVVGDFRAPDVLRFGFTPLYVGFEDVWRAANALRDVLVSGSWDADAYRVRAEVT